MIRPGPETRKSKNRLPQQKVEAGPPLQIPTASGSIPTTTSEELNRSIEKLKGGSDRLAKMSVQQRIEILAQCIPGIRSAASEWTELACEAKGIAPNSTSRAEEVLGGPVATMRQLQLYLRTMRSISRTGRPQLPGVTVRPDGRVGVQMTPCAGTWDPVVFFNFKATTWLHPNVDAESFGDSLAPEYTRLDKSGVSLILGAGNVSGIPAADVLTKLCVENRTVLLKMNPVNEYLGGVFERAFAPLIENDLLRVIYGDAGIGSSAVSDSRVSDVHITGSGATHDAIVWGADSADRSHRKQNDDPVLRKPISSELGNVSPWIVVPGQYSAAQLTAQAESIVSSMTNNAAFNCVATRAIVTWKQWPERERFLQLIEQTLSRVPQRMAYYPGAFDRYSEFAGMSPDAARGLLRKGVSGPRSMSGSKATADGTTTFVAGPNGDEQTLPWTFIRNVNPNEPNPLFSRESFVCVCAEVPIDADSPEEFVEKAVEFSNEKLWGTLACSMTLPNGFRRDAKRRQLIQKKLDELRFGAVSINQWSAILFALMSPPWGGCPGGTLCDPLSGIGWVHNSFMLTDIDKTVLEAPLNVVPKPVWSPTHNQPEELAWAMFELMSKPSLWNLTKLGCRAGYGAIAAPRKRPIEH
ncbi:MAG: aldehyde dehydrogenase family protein [Planctomycetota bacterium]|mgnify:CR=1 FL=1|nr:aldehyde dehydrogenase family protein [Planctomycetota bacterium]MDA1248934.1 aldehyde dehydrogenase family protein [Planctomycetota bacterium]